MMADYNGWADQREEEREVLDQLAFRDVRGCAGLCRGQADVARGLLVSGNSELVTQWEGLGKVGLKQDAKAREGTLV